MKTFIYGKNTAIIIYDNKVYVTHNIDIKTVLIVKKIQVL